MEPDKKVTEVYTVEITVAGWTDNLKHFRNLAKTHIEEMCLDVMSAGVDGCSSMKAKKIKIVKIEEVN